MRRVLNRQAFFGIVEEVACSRTNLLCGAGKAPVSLLPSSSPSTLPRLPLPRSRTAPSRGFASDAAAAGPAPPQPPTPPKPAPGTPPIPGLAAGEAQAGMYAGHAPASSKHLVADRGPVTWGSILATLIFGGAVLYRFRGDRDAMVNKYKEEGTMGRAAIGGPYKLTAHDGKPLSSEELKGQFLLLYFGFTQCPDACPEALYKMGEAVETLEKEGIVVTPVFITVDPARDPAHEVAAYVYDFHPRMVGLTGDMENVRQVARKFRVYFSKVQEEGPNDYLVDHTIIQYLMDPNGEFVTFYAKNSSAEELAVSVKDIIQEYAKNHPDYSPKLRLPAGGRSEALQAVAAAEAVRATQARRQRRGWFGWLTGRQ